MTKNGTAGGDTVSLERLRGKVVYVDFWASWCGPCLRSFPWMNEMKRRFGDKGLSILAINVATAIGSPAPIG